MIEALRVKGLGQIIVRVGIKALDAVARLAPGREHHNRCLVSAFSHPAQRREAVRAWSPARSEISQPERACNGNARSKIAVDQHDDCLHGKR